MFSTLLDRMSAAPRVVARTEVTRASSSDSVLSAITVDASSNAQSSSSTPPTSIDDRASISSNSLKLETTYTTPADQSNGRSRRNRTSVGTYNIKVLAGTAIHTPQKYCKGKANNNAQRRRTLGDIPMGVLPTANSSSATIENDTNGLASDEAATEDITTEDITTEDITRSVKGLRKSKSQNNLKRVSKKTPKQKDLGRRKTMPPTDIQMQSISKRLSVLGKRGRESLEESLAGLAKAKRELKNLADTPEFAKIETKPVVHEVWSNGKLVTLDPPKKKRKVEEPTSAKGKGKDLEQEKEKSKSQAKDAKQVDKLKSVRKPKVYLEKGLYAGQEALNLDWFARDSENYRADMEIVAPYRPNLFFPLPMWHGQGLLQTGRDFKLPFDICSPLPPGQPKPDEWRKTSSNRFIGEAGALWKKTDPFGDCASKCVCTPEDGCDEDCQNRIMFYECNDTNCGAGRAACTNRAFAELQERRKIGGPYRIGVEVIKTADRGYGVRSNRCFNPDQIIVEYTGEIITEDECDRRMNEDYKNNDCYYLMSFDQHMIIDATKGSIARFVNHSCKPNCKMVKWIVGGKPRMALFAGDKPIMTGDELTYDYNFDPFSAKNVQECRCGSDNCRGVLGPKPKDFKPIKETIKDVVKAGVKAGKRKLKELLGGAEYEDEDFGSPKKRKIKQLKTVRKSASSASMRVPKRTVKTVRKTVSSQVVKKAGSKRENVFAKKTVKRSSLKTYGKGQTKLASKNSSLTIVASESSPASKGSSSGTETMGPRKNMAKNKRGPRKAKVVLSEEYITVESGSSEEEPEDPDETEEEVDEDDW